jgi:hypothetical protein
MKIEVKDLKSNPFRSLERYPIRRDKVDALKASIASTDFWDNLLCRRNGAGFEIAYGHHRLEALKELKVKEVDIPIRDLDDATMLRILANENMEEWGTSASIEQETIRAVVQAFAGGKVELPPVKARDSNKSGACRVAPSFVPVHDAKSISSREKMLYSAATLAKFLGWREAKVHDALGALALVEGGLEIDFTDLSPKQAATVAREVKYAKKKTGDEELAVEIGNTLANEFRSPSGDPSAKNKRDVSVHTARDRTERLLRWNRVERIVAKGQQAELEQFDHQVKEFFAAEKVWEQAIEAATKAISKFAREAMRMAIRRLDRAAATESKFKACLTEKLKETRGSA